METQINPSKNMKNSRKKDSLKFQASGGGGIIVIGGTIIAAAIGVAFVAFKAKSNAKKGGEKSKKDGADEKEKTGLQSLLDRLGEREDSVKDCMEKNSKKHKKNEGTLERQCNCEGDEDNDRGQEGEESGKGEEGSEGTEDSSAELSTEAVWPLDLIEQRKEEFAFGSLIETQETDPDMVMEINKKHDTYKSSTVCMETTENTFKNNIKGDTMCANNFSFWNDELNHQVTTDVRKEALQILEEKTDDMFVFEDEEITIDHNHGHIFVDTSKGREQAKGNAHIDEANGEEEQRAKGGNDDMYIGVEVEQEQKVKGADSNVYIEFEEVQKEQEEKGGDNNACIEMKEEEEENGGYDHAYVEVEEVPKKQEEKGNDIAQVGMENKPILKEGREDIVHKEVNKDKEDEVEQEEDDITYVEVEEEQGDITHLEGLVVEEQQQEPDNITNVKVLAVVEEKAEEQAKKRDDLAHVELKLVEDGDAIVSIEDIVTEKEEKRVNVDTIEPKEVEEKIKEGDTANLEVKLVKEERGVNAVATEAEEVKDDNISLIGKEMEQQEIGKDVSYVEIKEEKTGVDLAKLQVRAAKEQKMGDRITLTEVEEKKEEEYAITIIEGNTANAQAIIVEDEEAKCGEDISHIDALIIEEGNYRRLEADAQEGLSEKSLEEDIKLLIEDENSKQESNEINNSSTEIDAQMVWHSEEVEIEKLSDSLYEINQNQEISEMINQKIGATHDDRENSTNDMNKEISVNTLVAVQEEVDIDLDIEMESNNTSKNSQIVLGVKENVSHVDNVVEDSHSNEILEYQNDYDDKASEISHVVQEEEKFITENEMKLLSEIPQVPTAIVNITKANQYLEESIVSQEKEDEDYNDKEEEDYDDDEEEEENDDEEAVCIEKEIKLQSTILSNTKKVFAQDGSKISVRKTKKKIDYLFFSCTKGLLLMVLALALAIGIHVLASHDSLDYYNRRLPKIYHELYQFFFPSYDRAVDLH